ncbi:ABC transporter permease [Roseibacillus persicicus]|uniref:ABC transporter permease n=1 Tax=Roseibacillus persicicus TaxID=454148 RepID=UPI00280F0A96|nr:ABC transporter permease [Roseibacillus persicicus]MDQ8189728.1 ABC transporter permease [Roseibacillus persicicus]
MIEIPLARLALALLPLVAVGWLMWKWSDGCGELLLATGRMIAQLLLVGYVLVVLFQVESPWVHLAVVGFMIAVSSWIAIRTVKENRARTYFDALLAIGGGGGVVFLFVIFGVLDLGPRLEARYVIPMAGMIFSNCMTAVTLCAERFDSERANGRELLQARNISWNAALIPQINSFLAVGLVSLPGMMTGQILAGASPLDAVRYQILVMAMILGAVGLSVAVFLIRRVEKS